MAGKEPKKTSTIPRFQPAKTTTKKTPVAKLVIPKTSVENLGDTLDTLLADCNAKGIKPVFGRGTLTLY